MIIDLKDHSVLRANKEALKSFVFLRVHRSETILKVKASKDCIASMMIEDHGRSADASIILDAPESYVLLTA